VTRKRRIVVLAIMMMMTEATSSPGGVEGTMSTEKRSSFGVMKGRLTHDDTMIMH
jgi:hypothetical protein